MDKKDLHYILEGYKTIGGALGIIAFFIFLGWLCTLSIWVPITIGSLIILIMITGFAWWIGKENEPPGKEIK